MLSNGNDERQRSASTANGWDQPSSRRLAAAFGGEGLVRRLPLAVAVTHHSSLRTHHSRRRKRSYKPDLVPRRVGVATISLGPRLRGASSSLPESSSETGRLSSPIWPCSGRGLACRPCHQGRGELLPRLFTLTPPKRGGMFSVPLSLGSLPVAVNDLPALWSPDFPLTLSASGRPLRFRRVYSTTAGFDLGGSAGPVFGGPGAGVGFGRRKTSFTHRKPTLP